MAHISHPPHLDINSLSASAFIPFCAFKTSMVISDPTMRLPNIAYPLCSSFQPTILDGQLCYKLEMNSTSGEGKRNQLMLLLDYHEDRSIYASPDCTEHMDFGNIDTLNMDETERRQTKEAKIHIDTLSSFKGFGGGTYKMTAVKRMTVTDDFLKMPWEDRKCNVEVLEACRTRKLLGECRCVPWNVSKGVQVGAQFSSN